MLLGYVYTMNSRESNQTLCEMISWQDCQGARVIWPNETSQTDQPMRLELEPGDTDMIVFLHLDKKVMLRIKSQLILRKLSPAELRDQTD